MHSIYQIYVSFLDPLSFHILLCKQSTRVQSVHTYLACSFRHEPELRPFVDLGSPSLNCSSNGDDGDMFAESVEAATMLTFPAAYIGRTSVSRL